MAGDKMGGGRNMKYPPLCRNFYSCMADPGMHNEEEEPCRSQSGNERKVHIQKIKILN